MNIDILRNVLKEKGLYVRDYGDKNIVAICPLCGDHPNSNKKGHLYISKDSNKPIYHCFFGNEVGTIRSLIYHLTSSNKIADSVITKDEMTKILSKSKIVKTPTSKNKKYNLPELKKESFLSKTEYIKKRTMSKTFDIDFYKHNLIFDIKEFIKLNPFIDCLKNEDKDFINKLQDKFVGFIGYNHNLLMLRNIDNNDKFKFRKYILQDYQYDLIDYISFHFNKNSNLVVLSEGVFDILGEIRANTLKLKNKARLFASGQSFSYSSLLKSICYNESLYNKIDVVILSDSDKEYYKYTKFINNTKHLINTIKIYYNKGKKDFGTYPIEPILYI